MINILDRAQRVRRGDDHGFALILTVIVTMIVTVAVAGVFAVVQPSVAGVKRSQDDAAAFIAARSGLEDAMAYLDETPSCRSASQVCAAALSIGNGSTKEVNTANLAAAGRPRPMLARYATAGVSDANAPRQTFSWRMLQQLTPEGYLRVVSTGTYPVNSPNAVSRTLVADFALKPSLLRFGYYTDYESFSPTFLNAYYKPRSVYISDASTYSNVASSYRGSTSAPRYANWTSPTTASNCGQHWYAEPALNRPGRSSNGSTYDESGRLGTTTSTTSGTAVSRSGTCDLTFNASMAQNGETYTRDAILSSGAGPKFQKPVWTLWGYTSGSTAYTDPAFTTAGKYYRGETMTNTPNTPQIAVDNITIPTSVGKDGIPTNACVYTGPTRVKLNGNGTATVTSPLTRTKNAASDSSCYPSNVSAGIVGWTYNYNTIGAGAIVTRNLGSAPSTGWPANPTRSTQTPSASNEVFYLNAPGSTDVTAHTDSSVAPYSGCSSTVKYSAAATATCAWTNVATATDSTSSTGWTSYSAAKCNAPPATPNRQLFECEYAKDTSATARTVDLANGQYKTFRDLVTNDLAGNTCVTKSGTALATCVDDFVENRLTPANSTSVTNGAHRYVATTTAGTATTTTTTGATGVGPDGTTNDSFFTQPTPAKETDTRNQVTVAVKRQVYNSSSSSWGSDTPAFTFTTTLHDYAYTAPRGMTYFPNEQDVTAYNVGTDTAGTAVRGTGVTPQSGDRQPGDLYIDGANKGKLSVLADNDVVVTGDITNPSGYTADTDAVSITAGQDVRNYHPVKCLDQDATDINNTTPGFCPNDITGLSTSTFISGSSYTSAAPAEQYVNMQPAADRNIYAAVFALSGSFGTDNYNRADPLGTLNIFGGLYQSHRGGNGVATGSTYLSGATLQYNYVDLQRANLPYVPPTRTGNDPHPWQIVGVSAG